ncbi:MAG TPA: hypothetical protein VHE12_05940 [bacterium]|nr:hypothetical protein [bacterium]
MDWKEYLLSLGTEKSLSKTLTLEAILDNYHSELKKDPVLMAKAEEVLNVMKQGYSLKKNFVKGPFQLSLHGGFEGLMALAKEKEAQGFRVEIVMVPAADLGMGR